MIRKLLILSLGFTSLYGQVEPTTPAKSFSLEEAKSYALKHNYNVEDQSLEVEKVKASIKKAIALSLPQVNAGYEAIWNAQIQPQAISKDAGFIPASQFPPGEDFIYLPFGTEYQTQWNVGANVTFSYSNFLARRGLMVLKEAKNLSLEDARITAQNEVEKSYYGVLVARENVKLLDENLESLNKNFTETRKLYENGFIEEQSVDQLELLVSNLTNTLSNARRQEDLALMILKFNMGMPQDSAIALSQTLDDFIYLEGEAQAKATPENFDPSQHIQYRRAKAQLDAAKLNVTNERSMWLPSLNLGVTHNEAYFSNDFDPVNWDTYWAPGTRVTGGLSWNINFLGRPASIQEAKVDAMRSEIAKELTYNQVNLQYERAVSEYRYALANYNTQRHNVEISKKIRDKERTKFKEGLSGSLDLTQAENQYLEKQQQYVQALLNLLNAKENLDQAMGRS